MQAGLKSYRMLLLSLLAFMVGFAAWMINGVLVTYLTNNGIYNWSSIQVGWLLGIPVLVGSVLRLPAGILADKYGGKWVMAAILLFSAVPMYLLSCADSFLVFLLLSFGFGISGSSFAAGVAYTSLWFPKEKQGTALGIFGAGNIGAGLTTMFAPVLLSKLTDSGSNPEAWRKLPVIYAVVLVLTAVIFLSGTKNKLPEASKSVKQRLKPLAEIRVWRFGLYYFFVFGGFVALAQWLIPYYVNVYSVTIVAAGFLTTAFNMPAGIIRILGGILSDKFGARTVLSRVFGISMICLILLFPPRVEIQTPGQGILAGTNGVVESVTEDQLVLSNLNSSGEKTSYSLINRAGKSSAIRFGIHNNEEGFLPLPAANIWHEVQVTEGDTVVQGQLIVKGVTSIYFQANKWIFTFLVFLLGIMMGIGSAAVYKFIPDYYPDDVGTVGGIVGVIGGLGGFAAPIIFGYLLSLTGVWSTNWMFLFLIAVTCFIWLKTAKVKPHKK